MDKNLLNDAVNSDERPTPGYMFADIAKSTLSNYQACTEIQEFLNNKLKIDNPNVKYKALVVIKAICKTGRMEFKRDMSRAIDNIKECLQYRGAPDPITGDEKFRRVREAAKDAIDAIYDSAAPVTTSAVAAANRIQGIGGGYVEDNIQKKEKGFLSSMKDSFKSLTNDNDDNSGYQAHTGSGNFIQASSNKFSSSSQSTSSGSYNPNGGQTVSATGMVGIGSSYVPEEKTWYGTTKKTENTEDFGYATNRGNNAYGQGDLYKPQSFVSPNTTGMSTSAAAKWDNKSGKFSEKLDTVQVIGSGGIVPEINSITNGFGRAGLAASDGAYERAMIESLCEPSGLKPVPPEDKLKDFLVSAATLSAEFVGPVLIDLLNNDAWQSRTKALIVIASLGKASGCSSHVTWWQNNSSEISGLSSDSKSSVRIQAAKTLRSLKITDTSVSNTQPKQEVNQQQSNNLLGDDLLGDNYDDQPPPVLPPPVPTSNNNFLRTELIDSNNDDIFSGMSVGDRDSLTGNRESLGSMFSGMNIDNNRDSLTGRDSITNRDSLNLLSFSPKKQQSNSHHHQQQQQQEQEQLKQESSSVFDFMSTSTITPSSSSSVHVLPQSKTQSSMDAFDFLNDEPSNEIPTTMPLSTLPSVPSNQNNNMFGDMIFHNNNGNGNMQQQQNFNNNNMQFQQQKNYNNFNGNNQFQQQSYNYGNNMQFHQPQQYQQNLTNQYTTKPGNVDSGFSFLGNNTTSPQKKSDDSFNFVQAVMKKK